MVNSWKLGLIALTLQLCKAQLNRDSSPREIQFEPQNVAVTLSTTHPVGAALLIKPRLSVQTNPQTQHGGVRLTIDSPFIGAFSVQPDYIEGSSDFDIILNDPGIFNQLDFDRDHAKEFAISVIGIMNMSDTVISEQMSLSMRVIDDFKSDQKDTKRIFTVDFQEVSTNFPLHEGEEVAILRLKDPYQLSTLSFSVEGELKDLFSIQHRNYTEAVVVKKSCPLCHGNLNDSFVLVVEVIEISTGLSDDTLVLLRAGEKSNDNSVIRFNPVEYHTNIAEKSSETTPVTFVQVEISHKRKLKFSLDPMSEAFDVDDSGLFYVKDPEMITIERLGTKPSFNVVVADETNRTATGIIHVAIEPFIPPPSSRVTFTQNVYKVSIPDLVETEDMVVGSVGISPLDTPAVYSLLSGGDGCFAVNATNGSIVRKCLEIKREAAVNLTISAASDPPTVGQTVALCEVHIAIETIGSISPSIVYPNDMDSVVTVDEGRNSSMPLLAIAANDTDAAELKYAVLQVESFDRFGQPQQKDIQKYFEFVRTSDICSRHIKLCKKLNVSNLDVKEIFLRVPLKSLDIMTVHITVGVKDVSHPLESIATKLIIIHIRRPYLITPFIAGSQGPGDTPHFHISLPEDSLAGTSVFELVAFSDAPAYQRGCSRKTNNFTISGDGKEFFEIDDNTGIMSLVRPLTKTGNFNLLASVVNCDRMATALLTVAVTSDPDRPISFNQTFYSTEIPDGLPKGTDILQVSLADKNEMANVNFTLMGDDADLFHIDRRGVISTKSNISLSRVDLFVRARKHRQDIMSSSAAYTEAMALVYLNVTRSHHQPLKFRFFHNSSEYLVEVMENIPVGSFILQPEVMVPTEELRNSVTYRLSDLTPELEAALMLDRRSGLITTKGSLHGVVGSYKLLIEATDHYGTTSVATLMLRVASSSQCLPRFISPNSDGVIVEIDQDLPTDSLVTTFHADTAVSCRLKYKFVDIASLQYISIWEPFVLDEDTGDLRITKAFSQESPKRYRLRVAALDTSSDGALNSEMEIVVILVSKMDKEPIFVPNGCGTIGRDQCEQIGEVSLAMELSREVADGHLIGSVGQNVRKHPQAEGRLNYYIVGSNSGSLVVNQRTGEIRTSGPLRTDSHNPIEMKVLVTTKEHLDREELMQLNKFPRLSVANVRIELAGTSGSAPQFPSKTVTTICSTDAVWGHQVTKVVASPAVEFSEAVFYRITQVSYLYKRVKSLMDGQFKVDTNTGEVFVNTNLKDFVNGIFILTLEASNEPTFTMNDSSTMQLEVWLFEPKHLVRLLVDEKPEDTVAKVPHLLKMINSTLGYEAQYVNAEYHYLSSYNASTDGTELLVVIVDRESQRLLEQSEVTQLVEVNRQQQEKLPSMFDQIGGAQPFETKWGPQPSKLTGLIVALAIIICLLVAGCVAIGVIVYRNRLRLLQELDDIKNGKGDLTKAVSSDVMTISTVTENPIWSGSKGNENPIRTVYPSKGSTLTDGTAVVRVRCHTHDSLETDDPLYETLTRVNS